MRAGRCRIRGAVRREARGLFGVGRVPAVAAASDPAVPDEAWHDSIQVVRVGARRQRDLRNRDAGAFADQRQRLIAACPGWPTADVARCRTPAVRRVRVCWPIGLTECRLCCLQLVHFGVQLGKATIDIDDDPVSEFRHTDHAQSSVPLVKAAGCPRHRGDASRCGRRRGWVGCATVYVAAGSRRPRRSAHRRRSSWSQILLAASDPAHPERRGVRVTPHPYSTGNRARFTRICVARQRESVSWPGAWTRRGRSKLCTT